MKDVKKKKVQDNIFDGIQIQKTEHRNDGKNNLTAGQNHRYKLNNIFDKK